MSTATANPEKPNAKSSVESAVEGACDSLMTIAVEQHDSRRATRRWWRLRKRRTLRATAIVVDMSNIRTTPDRQAIACLVRFLYGCARRNCGVAICNASPETMVTFEIYGVHHLAKIFDNVESAAAFLSSTEPLHED